MIRDNFEERSAKRDEDDGTKYYAKTLSAIHVAELVT